MKMDLNSPMTLDAWRQTPTIPGFEKAALLFEAAWLQKENPLLARMMTREELAKNLDKHIKM